jgi:rubredoxin
MWLQKLILKLKYRLARLLEVKPFLRVDEHAYCPACGARKGSIAARTDGSVVVVQHACAVCKWQWLEDTVTHISKDAISHVWNKEDEDQK